MKKIASQYDRVEVLDIETRREAPTPTYETLQELKLRYNFKQRPYLIIGADNLASLHKWHKYEILKEEVEFVVAARRGYQLNEKFRSLDVACDISSTRLREVVEKDYLPPLVADEILRYYKEHNER